MEVLEGAVRRRKQGGGLKPIETKAVNGGLEGVVEGEEEEPLSPSARLFHEPDFNVYIIAIMGSNTKIYPEILRAQLPHTLLKHPRFSSLQVLDEHGNMKWVRTKVDLDKHIIIPDVDPNMDQPDKFVEDYVRNLSTTKIDMSKPLWDLHLLHVRTSQAESVAVFRTHHSLGDGTSLMSLLLACTRKISDPDQLPTIPGRKKKATESSKGVLKYLFGILFAIRMMWNTVIDVLMFLATALFLKDTNTPLKGGPDAAHTPRRFVHRTVSLDDMKFVKNAMKGTINDVALGITQAGLSRYLNRRYGEESKEDKGSTQHRNNLPKNIRLRSTLLINIRPSAGIQATDMMEKNTEAKWGNWIGYVLLPFRIALRDDPLDYIREAKATIDRKKCSLEAIYTFSIAEIVLKLFGFKRAGAMSHRILDHTTMGFSNLVGPMEEIGFYGHSMAYLAPSSYGQPHALMINFQSYINQMTIVLSVDEKAVPDPDRLLDEIEESLRLVKQAVIAKGLQKV
ncbi:O-acyltransferase WSD1, C-terminal [Dillenia turbinata]|uniref:O-acyltransferase WSD1, C-terminal n=1 Tax=Dillenia turbinata TaxID=194707 RepID=A0AAN8UWP9_9MAGN